MKKILISGSWRYEDAKLEAQVRKTVREILDRGDEIITGGALGVDFWTLDEVLKLNAIDKIQVFLPSPLNFYKRHYLKRAQERIITRQQALNLITQLKTLKKLNRAALIETTGVTTLNQASYFDRDSKEVASADELIAFQVNQSKGTQDTIDKARRKGINVQVHQFAL
jgi:hypothetical protein